MRVIMLCTRSKDNTRTRRRPRVDVTNFHYYELPAVAHVPHTSADNAHDLLIINERELFTRQRIYGVQYNNN
jgi:hypothetical protein